MQLLSLLPYTASHLVAEQHGRALAKRARDGDALLLA